MVKYNYENYLKLKRGLYHMGDIKKGLPVRTEEDADYKLQVKLVDSTNPDSQQGEINTDSHLAVYNDGIYDVGDNSVDPSTIGLIGHTRDAAVDKTHQIERITVASPGSDNLDPANINAMDTNNFLHGWDGAAWDRLTATGGSLDVNITGSDPLDVNLDGVYALVTNLDPDNVGTIQHVRAVAPGDAEQTFRSTGATPTSDALDGTTVHAIDVNSFGMAWDGAAWDRIRKDATSEGLLVHLADHDIPANNPIPVYITDQVAGEDVHDFDDNAGVDVAAAGADNHDYTVTALKTFYLKQWQGSASSRGKWELQVETAAASGVFTTKAVRFTTESSPSFHEALPEPIDVVAGAIVRIIRTNRDNQAQCMYSYIHGEERTA